MIDKRIREAYREVDVPDLKEEILSAVTSAERKQERRRLRPAAAVLLSVLISLIGYGI